MKKLFLTMAMAILVINVNAQWKPSVFHPGDELKVVESYYSTVYEGECGYFICWNTNKAIRIETKRGVFNYQDFQIDVLIGFYKNDKLIGKMKSVFYVPRRVPDAAYSDVETGKRIINHLKNTGDVRIIAPKYGETEFDLTIPMNKTLK